jgi:serine protease Do
VEFKIFRDGKTLEKKITLRQRSDAVAVKDEKQGDGTERSDEEEVSSKSMTFDNLGLTVRQMTSEEKKKATVERGIIVSESKPYGEAFNNQIGTGDIILDADKQELNSPKDLKKIIDKRKPGDAIIFRIKKSNGIGFYAVQIPKE